MQPFSAPALSSPPSCVSLGKVRQPINQALDFDLNYVYVYHFLDPFEVRKNQHISRESLLILEFFFLIA